MAGPQVHDQHLSHLVKHLVTDMTEESPLKAVLKQKDSGWNRLRKLPGPLPPSPFSSPEVLKWGGVFASAQPQT